MLDTGLIARVGAIAILALAAAAAGCGGSQPPANAEVTIGHPVYGDDFSSWSLRSGE